MMSEKTRYPDKILAFGLEFQASISRIPKRGCQDQPSLSTPFTGILTKCKYSPLHGFPSGIDMQPAPQLKLL